MNFKEIELNIDNNFIFDEDSKKLFNSIKKEASNDDLILITGSNYIAKEIFNEK